MLPQFNKPFFNAYVYITLVFVKNAFLSSLFPNSALILIHLICTEIISHTAYCTAFHFSYRGPPLYFFLEKKVSMT